MNTLSRVRPPFYRHLGKLLVALFVLSPLSAREPVEGQHAMVASAQRLASEAGVSVMRAGGNAIDGAVATGFALAVTLPSSGNLGGGGFMIIRTAEGKAVALDFREVAPLGAHRDMYLDENGAPATLRSRQGHLANGVPGTVAGLEHAWKHYGSGKVSWHDIIEPARRIADDGFVMSPFLVQHLYSHRERLAANESSRGKFLRNGDFFTAGEVFRQPDLAATLSRLQAHGAADFYTGKTADLIVQDQVTGGGLITHEDLAVYRPKEREVLRGTYRGYEFLTMPPPSSGGIALTQILGMLESYDLRALRLQSTAYIHLVSEAMRRAFHDRALHLGDPDYYEVPRAQLTDPDYIRQLMHDFEPSQATSSELLVSTIKPPAESMETTHFSTADSAGNVVSCTYTLNGNYGNSVTVAGAGFLMNNEMDDFTAKVGVKNMYGLLQSEANAVHPGKRPLSSMTPTILLKDGQPVLATGASGGPTIITTVLHILLNVIDHKLSLALAADAPRFHHQWQPDRISHEPFLTSPDTLDRLRDMGHEFALRRLYSHESNRMARYFGDAESIMFEPETGLLLGVSDTRYPDAAPAGF
ncbi:MAG: gamma-glutamyltransferase [Opitutaceae bacterium]|jgi:gamma-glutamyltranspeptidase / glutathione hydrolase|nr:gamma-glutamyltransferase [Opitutaceae bacterium]